MEQICPHCGATAGRPASSCAECGGSLRGGRNAARPARAYDGYAVARRALVMAPAWLLLLIIAFALVLLLLSWARRPAGDLNEAFRNEATNQPPTPAADARTGGPGLKTMRAAGDAEGPTAAQATPAGSLDSGAQASEADEADSFSVQVGAFADHSQANEQVSRLRAAGFEARVVESMVATRFRYQVRSGRYATREEAARQSGLLRSAGVAGQTVIVEPGK